MKDENPRDDAGSSAPSASGERAEVSVGSLMEERRCYELWLAALNARRAETPKHVFARVHADYTTRLESVVKRLAGQVGGLRTELTTLATRIASIEEQQHRARDERAEAELRAQVGEMNAEEWAAAAKKADDAVVEFEKQHASAIDALRRTREFLADAERPATPALSSPVVAPAAAAPAAAAATATAQSGGSAPRLRPLPGSSRQDAAAANGQGAGHFDELAFLSSVVDANAPGAAVPKAPPAAAKPQAPTAAANFAPVARPAPPPSRNPFATRAQEKIINNDGAAGPRIDARKPGAPGGLAGNVSGDQPIVLRDKSSEAAKSLKCGECGATNLPTEWYCERCGAELASM